MARFLGLIITAILLVPFFLLPSPAHAGDWPTVAQAYAACVRGQNDPQGHATPKPNVDKCTPDISENAWYVCFDYANWGGTYNECGKKSGGYQSTCGTDISTQWVSGVLDSSTTPTVIDPGGCACTFVAEVAWGGVYDRTVGSCVGTGHHVWELTSTPSPADLSSDLPCGGTGSCFDAQTNQFCALDFTGAQVCVPGPLHDSGSSADGKIPQTCVQGDGVSVCAGTPQGPLPNLTPVPPVTDLAQVQTYTVDGVTVYTGEVVVRDTTSQGNNSHPGDGSTSSGATGNSGNNGSEGSADSAGQCSDGSTPSAGGCGAGYRDRGCDAPPTCSGDPLLCAGLREQHASRCADSKYRADVPSAASIAGALQQGLDNAGIPAAGADPAGGDFIKEIDVGTGGTGGNGTGPMGLDDSGWGFTRSCPIQSKSFTLAGQTVTIDYGQACGALSLGFLLVQIMAYLAAARIIFMQG